MKNTERLTARMHTAVNALLLHPKIDDAARECGIPSRTLYSWMKQGHFTAALAAARRRVVDITVSRIQQASGAALGALLRILKDPKASSTSRVQSARTILEISIQQRPAGIHVPAASSASEIGKALEAVSRAVARGDLLPAEASAIAAVFKTQLDAVTAADWERRLTALEEHSGAPGGHDEDDEDDDDGAAA